MSDNKPPELLNVSIENGKYTVIQEANGQLKALRNGEDWQDLTGNKLVLSLAQEIKTLREKIDLLEAQMESDARQGGIGL